MNAILAPFAHEFMLKAICIATLVGLLCGLLSAFLILKGWALIGDAFSHAIVPGVAGAYLLGIPFALGAFMSGGLAACAMLFLNQKTALRQDAIIGLVFTSFFALGLFIASLAPIAVDISTIALGNILAISIEDSYQVVLVATVAILILALKWRDFMLIFFDENFAISIGLKTTRLKLLFFAILAAATVAAMQAVGAFLVVALVITPGATAYLLTDRFGVLLVLSGGIGLVTTALATYLTYFFDLFPGGFIIVMQSVLFACVLISAPRHGLLAKHILKKHNTANA